MTTNNNQQSVRYYEPEYKGILGAIFTASAAFANALSQIQTTDGVKSNTKAFTVKTNATPVVINNYDTGANVGMGTGTGSTSRFGKRTEVIFADTDVEYSYSLAIHEGIDRNTVNAEFDQAVADRLELQSQAQVRYMNVKNGAFISASANKTLTYDATKAEAVKELFNAASKEFTNNEVDAEKTAYLTPDLYTAVLDLVQTNTLKGATVNIDNGEISKYKGFKLVETPEKYFATGDVAYFTADGIIVPFVGINTARTIDSEDFDGKALQAAAKGGQFVLDDNKKAIIKVTAVVTG